MCYFKDIKSKNNILLSFNLNAIELFATSLQIYEMLLQVYKYVWYADYIHDDSNEERQDTYLLQVGNDIPHTKFSAEYSRAETSKKLTTQILSSDFVTLIDFHEEWIQILC